MSSDAVFFRMIGFDLVNFPFNCCIRLEFLCFDFSTDSDVDIKISILSSKYVVIVERCLQFSIVVDEKTIVGYFSTLLSSDRRSIFDLRGTRSIPIFLDYSCCFTFNSLNYLCYLCNL